MTKSCTAGKISTTPNYSHKLAYPNLQPTHTELARHEIRIRVHFPLIVERAQSMAQVLLLLLLLRA